MGSGEGHADGGPHLQKHSSVREHGPPQNHKQVDVAGRSLCSCGGGYGIRLLRRVMNEWLSIEGHCPSLGQLFPHPADCCFSAPSQ